MQSLKFSVVCPLYKDGYVTLDRFIKHLKEQDYKNWEVILSYNSPDNDAKDFVSKNKSLFKGVDYKEVDAGYKPEWKAGNHCNAFNVGAKEATGDVLLFLDPDVYLLPGILREYKDAFDAHPDVDFVYGEYDFEGAGRIRGRDYSEYELKCANYISGGFPVRKSAFRGWDPKLESLQDWDMWLSVVDGGGKGFYIGRPCFITEAPKADGISANQAANWKKRYAQVRKKHGFPVSKAVVTSLGAPLHATNMAEILGVDTRVLSNIPNFKPHDYETMYLLGFYPLAWESHMALFYDRGNFQNKLATKKRVIHWIGTDIFQMQHKLSWMAWKNISTFLNDPQFDFVHLCESEQTQAELKELGIDAEVIPLPPKKTFDLVPLPKKFTVGVYINPTQDMYYEEFMYEVADAMPDVDFKFFGNRNMKKRERNKEWVGWVNMESFLPHISALVRLTLHDGLPIGPIEALQAGRNVLSNTPLKHALHITVGAEGPNRADVIKQIRKMQKMKLNKEGSDYWRREMSHELYRERMSQHLSFQS